MVDAGYLITIVTWDRSVKSQLPLSNVRYLGVDLLAPMSSLRVIFSLPKYYSSLRRLLRNEEMFDICFLSHMMLLPMIGKLPTHRFIYDIPEYLNYDLSDYFGRFKRAARFFIERFEKKLLSRADGVIYVGSKDDWLRSYVSGARSSIEINNFPDLTRVPNFGKENFLKSLYSGKKVVIYIGGLSCERGVLRLVNSVKSVLESEPQAHFVLMGRFRPDTCLITDKIKALGVQSSVDVIEHEDFEDMLSYLSISELGIALYEVQTSERAASKAFGKFNSRKILTYMQMGLPVLVSAGNPFSELVLENKCGKAVDDSNQEDLAASILSILHSPEDLGQSGKNAIRSYNWQNEEPRFLEFLDNIHI